jgi:hypothetical protein
VVKQRTQLPGTYNQQSDRDQEERLWEGEGADEESEEKRSWQPTGRWRRHDAIVRRCERRGGDRGQEERHVALKTTENCNSAI